MVFQGDVKARLTADIPDTEPIRRFLLDFKVDLL
jgi:hypothetical protein